MISQALTSSRAERLPRILLVDDDRHVRRMLVRGLERAGLEVIQACNGRDALYKLRHERFDAVVCDVRMPVMNGIELLEALAHESLDVPVLLMSGSLEVSDLQTAGQLGVVDFLKKPFPIAELQTRALRAATNRIDDPSPPLESQR
jgi:CheY-like chemotaxis protein